MLLVRRPDRRVHLVGAGELGEQLRACRRCLCKRMRSVALISSSVIVFRRLSVSTSFVLAALRALHVDASGAAGKDGHDGGKAVR